MLFNIIAVSSLLVATATASAKPAPYLIGGMADTNLFGLMKRQTGYQPTETACAQGTTCEESCGPGSVLCDDSANPSPSFQFYCYNPGKGDTCCPDRSGSKYHL